MSTAPPVDKAPTFFSQREMVALLSSGGGWGLYWPSAVDRAVLDLIRDKLVAPPSTLISSGLAGSRS